MEEELRILDKKIQILIETSHEFSKLLMNVRKLLDTLLGKFQKLKNKNRKPSQSDDQPKSDVSLRIFRESEGRLVEVRKKITKALVDDVVDDNVSAKDPEFWPTIQYMEGLRLILRAKKEVLNNVINALELLTHLESEKGETNRFSDEPIASTSRSGLSSDRFSDEPIASTSRSGTSSDRFSDEPIASTSRSGPSSDTHNLAGNKSLKQRAEIPGRSQAMQKVEGDYGSPTFLLDLKEFLGLIAVDLQSLIKNGGKLCKETQRRFLSEFGVILPEDDKYPDTSGSSTGDSDNSNTIAEVGEEVIEPIIKKAKFK